MPSSFLVQVNAGVGRWFRRPPWASEDLEFVNGRVALQRKMGDGGDNGALRNCRMVLPPIRNGSNDERQGGSW